MVDPIGWKWKREFAFDARVMKVVVEIETGLVIPVDGQSVRVDHIAENDHRLCLAFIDRCLIDPLVVHVAPARYMSRERPK